MKTVGNRIEPFKVTGVKPGFNQPEEKGVSAFEAITEQSFPGKWKVFYFYPKDFTFVCPTEIVGFAKLQKDFNDRDAVLLAGSTDNEFVKLAWRREHKDLDRLNHWQFGDVKGSLVDQLGVRDTSEGVALRATFIVDPDNVIQHVSVNNLNVGRSPDEILRVLDGLQTDELCPCNRNVGGTTL
jgi:lipoyl-dependent peroxiredoxin subunit C